MLVLVLLAATLVSAPEASMQCAATGAALAGMQTEPARGPGGMAAVLRVSSADDHSKNSHECMADYQLLLRPAAGGGAETVDLLSSDDEYGRDLSARLGGFSNDGRRIFALLSETGKHPLAMLVAYDTGTRSVQLVDLARQFARLAPRQCMRNFDVLGSVESGAVVLQLIPAGGCAANGRWMVDTGGGRPRRLPPGAEFHALYSPGAGAR